MKKSLFGFVTFFFISAALAENYYVDDTLRIGLRAKPDKTLPSIMVIQSGASIELIEKQGSYAKIRATNGTEGWVKSAYLTRKAPAIEKLKQASAQIEQLENQIKLLKLEMAETSAKEISSLKMKIQDMESDKQTLQQQVSNTEKENKVINQVSSLPVTTSSLQPFNINKIDNKLLYTLSGAIVVLLSMGFLFGVSWHKKQVTKRLGGLSI